MNVDELSTRVTDPQAEGRDHERGGHHHGGERSTGRRSPDDKNEAGQHEREAASPDELLRELFVLVQRASPDDHLDATLFRLPRSGRHNARSQKERLQRDYAKPGAGTNPAGP